MYDISCGFLRISGKPLFAAKTGLEKQYGLWYNIKGNL